MIPTQVSCLAYAQQDARTVRYILDVRMHEVAEMPAAVSQDAYLVETKSDNQDLKHLYHAVSQNMHYLQHLV